jgi:hypothetical protein
MYMKITSLLTVTVIAGAILLVIGTSIEMAFAAPNPLAPGQSGLSSLAHHGLPPGHLPNSIVGLSNLGQCKKAFDAGMGMCPITPP